MKRTKLTTRACIASAFFAAAFAPLALGQTAPATPATEAPEAAKSEVIELSPFEVSTNTQEGYMATSSLAGSRLNTQLRDIPAAISVVTQQFLQDTASTNLEGLLVYTNNTEVGGLSGNYGGDSTLVRQAPQKATRIRGLDGADITRDFFSTDIPFDSYNTMQVDINRGANSILFGLGSPAGIINYMLKTPTMLRSKYSADFRVNQYGSLRTGVDLDHAIIPKVLGIRVNAVNSEQEFQQAHKFDHTKRLDTVIRFTPKIADSIYTQIQARFEKGRTRANRPETTPPSDYISNWYTQLNKFSNPNTWPGYTFATVPNQEPYLAAFQAGPGGNWWDEMGVIYSNPGTSTTGGTGIPDAFRQRGGTGVNAGSWISPANPTSNTNKALHYLNLKSTYTNNPTALGIINGYEKVTGKVFAGGWGWSDTQITDTSVFDYYNDSLAGPNNSQWNDFHDENASIVQTFFNGRLGYEASVDRQRFRDGEYRLIDDSSRLAIDINQKLRDNVTANPNYGRAVLVSGNNATANIKDRETVRATAFYKLNFADFIKKDWLAKALGNHVFTGVASTQTFKQLSYSYSMYKWGEGYTKRYENKPGLIGVHYLNADVDLSKATTLAGAHIHGLDAVQTPASTLNAMVVDNIGVNGVKLADWTKQNVDVWSYKDAMGTDRLYGNQPTSFKDRDTAKAFIWQSYFLDNTVVGLFAVRNDNYEKLTKGNNPVNPAYESVGTPFNPNWAWDGQGSSRIAANASKRSYGIMLHTPKFIKKHLPWDSSVSLGYNESSNFQPGQLGRDPYGNQYQSPSGSTKDYTVLINTLNDRVTLRATWFKSVQANTEVKGLGDWSVKSRLTRAMNGLMVEAWGATGSGWSGRAQTTPESVVNKWFFGSAVDAAVAGTPLPTGWTVANHPELLNQPLRIRASAATVKEGDTFVNPQGQSVAYTEPPITPEEAEYRRAWFRARTDEQWARPFGMTLFKSLNLSRDVGYWGGIWPEGGVPNLKGIGDNMAKGMEVELTVNPTPNWRVIANVSKVDATTANVWSAVKTYIDDFGKVAKDGWDPTVLSGTSINYWHRDGYADVDAWGNNGGQMLGWDWFNDVEKTYLTKKAAEGRSVGELRTWHFNVISGYDFTRGSLKGLGIGGAMRWQSKSTLGYYPKYLSDIKVWVDDLDQPIKGPSEANYDAWVSYKYKLSKKVDLRVQLNVRDLFNNKSLIPTRSNPDGSYAQYRIPAGRSWELSTTFDF